MLFRFPSSSRSCGALGVLMIAVACSQRADTSSDTASSASSTSTPAAGADTTTTVRGAITSVSPTQLVVATPTGNVTVAVTQPLQVYSRQPATLADVKDNGFIGVTTVQQPDGP